MGLRGLFGFSVQGGTGFGIEARFDGGFSRGRDITDEFVSRTVPARRIAPPADYVVEERPDPIPAGDKAKMFLGVVSQFGCFIR